MTDCRREDATPEIFLQGCFERGVFLRQIQNFHFFFLNTSVRKVSNTVIYFFFHHIYWGGSRKYLDTGEID